MPQTTMFERLNAPEGVEVYTVAPSVRGSTTSAQAADSLDSKTLNALQWRVLLFIQGRPEGVTDEQIANGLGLNPSTARPRRIELAKRGLIVEAGVRKTASKRNAVAWRVA